MSDGAGQFAKLVQNPVPLCIKSEIQHQSTNCKIVGLAKDCCAPSSTMATTWVEPGETFGRGLTASREKPAVTYGACAFQSRLHSGCNAAVSLAGTVPHNSSQNGLWLFNCQVEHHRSFGFT